MILSTVACESECPLDTNVMLGLPDGHAADFENQGAHHLAKLNDPDGKRTIGESFWNRVCQFGLIKFVRMQVFLLSRIASHQGRRTAGSDSYETSTRHYRMVGIASSSPTRSRCPRVYRGQKHGRRRTNSFL